MAGWSTLPCPPLPRRRCRLTAHRGARLAVGVLWVLGGRLAEHHVRPGGLGGLCRRASAGKRGRRAVAGQRHTQAGRQRVGWRAARHRATSVAPDSPCPARRGSAAASPTSRRASCACGWCDDWLHVCVCVCVCCVCCVCVCVCVLVHVMACLQAGRGGHGLMCPSLSAVASAPRACPSVRPSSSPHAVVDVEDVLLLSKLGPQQRQHTSKRDL
jgi:hypothetical protein